eukprot:5220535-Pleurochrysis_carterae.AAC.1
MLDKTTPAPAPRPQPASAPAKPPSAAYESIKAATRTPFIMAAPKRPMEILQSKIPETTTTQ